MICTGSQQPHWRKMSFSQSITLCYLYILINRPITKTMNLLYIYIYLTFATAVKWNNTHKRSMSSWMSSADHLVTWATTSSRLWMQICFQRSRASAFCKSIYTLPCYPSTHLTLPSPGTRSLLTPQVPCWHYIFLGGRSGAVYIASRAAGTAGPLGSDVSGHIYTYICIMYIYNLILV